MTAAKHPHSGTADSVPPLQDDLERDPGINDSKGNFARSDANPDLIKGENTTEGDTMNDVTRTGSVGSHEGRTNK
jgi:hypothetical protein